MPSSTVYNLLEACRAKGCPICQLEQQGVERYLDQQFYENVNSPKWRDQLRLSLGFCHEHAWLGVDHRLGDALGYSIIYRDLVNSVLKQLETDPSRNKSAKSPDGLAPRKTCPVCEHRNHVTRTYLTVLVEQLKTPEMSSALQESDGLCLPHLRMALAHMRVESDREQLIQLHRLKLEGLRAELDEFIRKNDYQAAQEGFGSEGDAWLRAIAHAESDFNANAVSAKGAKGVMQLMPDVASQYGVTDPFSSAR